MYLILGLGLSGLATAAFLKSGEKSFVVWDDAESSRNHAQNQGDTLFKESNWKDITHIILGPGLAFGVGCANTPSPHPMIQWAREHNIPMLTDCNLLIISVKAHNSHAQFIGITGTNGKSTTTALLTHVLQENNYDAVMGGNIGVPALSLDLHHDIYVLELSSFQLERSPFFELDFALWTNLSKDHLDKHGSMDIYQKAKERIFEKSNKKCIMIDDDLSRNVATRYPDAVSIQTCESIQHLPPHPFLKGVHNDQNRVLVYETLRVFGLSHEAILKGMATFQGLSHRQQFAGDIMCGDKRITFINDSKSTSAEATKQALQTFSNNYLILGGEDKTDGVDSLLEYSARIKRVYFFGKARKRFSKTFSTIKIPQTSFEHLKDAVEAAFIDAKNDLLTHSSMQQTTVLFSPACASFDQYKNFEERGCEFVNIVHGIKNESC